MSHKYTTFRITIDYDGVVDFDRLHRLFYEVIETYMEEDPHAEYIDSDVYTEEQDEIW